MTAPANAATATVPTVRTTARVMTGRARPIYWSLRRELWENRWVYIAPVGVATFLLLVFLGGSISRPAGVPQSLVIKPTASPNILAESGLGGPMVLLMVAVIVGVFYSLEALQSERRDRSILFWKSLPVSDAATVFAKAIVPLLVLPALTCALIVLSQLAMLVLGTAIMLFTGAEVAPVWATFPFPLWPVMLYFVAALTLWHVPLYAWLLLVSAWARRAALLWAILPVLAVAMVERHTFHTSYVTAFLAYRSLGFFNEAFSVGDRAGQNMERLPHLTPANFFTSPGLWLGLLFAAACLIGAARLRRERDPI